MPIISNERARYIGKLDKSNSTLNFIAKDHINVITLRDGKDPRLGIPKVILDTLLLEYIYIKIWYKEKFYETTRNAFKRIAKTQVLLHSTLEYVPIRLFNVGKAVLADLQEQELQMDIFDVGKFEARTSSSRLKTIYLKSLEKNNKRKQQIRKEVKL